MVTKLKPSKKILLKELHSLISDHTRVTVEVTKCDNNNAKLTREVAGDVDNFIVVKGREEGLIRDPYMRKVFEEILYPWIGEDEIDKFPGNHHMDGAFLQLQIMWRGGE